MGAPVLSTVPNAGLPAGRRKKAEDAEPKTLYVHRKLRDASALREWAAEQGFKTALPRGDMHVTIAFSKAPVDWSKIQPDKEILRHDMWSPGRSVEALGTEGAVVLRFESPALQERWQEFRDAGASWDHDGYRPHVTITYEGGDVDLSQVTPYDGPLEFDGEIFGEVKAGSVAKAKKAEQALDKKLKLDVEDDEDQLEKMLTYIKEIAAGGHSFTVVVDPGDSEYERAFSIDGDGAFRIRDMMASDSARPYDRRQRLALDEGSARYFDEEGRLHVTETNICKACVNPYKGSEIPDYERLGLDPDKTYQLFRPPEELEKAAATSNGIQLMRKHIPVDAEDHQAMDVAGAVGTSARWEPPFVKNAITIWPSEDIEGIETGKKFSLSPGYHYEPVMEAGEFEGKSFDGRMTKIRFNHLAIVEEGRQGPDVVIEDSIESLQWSAVERAILQLMRRP